MKYWIPQPDNTLKEVTIHIWRNPIKWWHQFKGSNVSLVTTYARYKHEKDSMTR